MYVNIFGDKVWKGIISERDQLKDKQDLTKFYLKDDSLYFTLHKTS